MSASALQMEGLVLFLLFNFVLMDWYFEVESYQIACEKTGRFEKNATFIPFLNLN